MKLVASVAALAAAAALGAPPALADLKVGAQAPDFTAPAFLAGAPTTFKLSEALKKGPVVVYFFPAAFTGGCNIEAHLFSEAADQFKAEKATVVGVTAGKIDQLAEFSKDTRYCGGKFPVAADQGAKIAKQYDSTLSPTISSRTSYVIGKDGKVVLAYNNMNPNEHVTHTLAAVKSLNGKK